MTFNAIEYQREYAKQYAPLHREEARQAQRAYRARNPDKIKEYTKKYAKENKDKIRAYRVKTKEKMQSYQREWSLRNKESISRKIRVKNLRRRYGMTLESYDALLLSQNKRCACCGNVEGNKALQMFVIDHDHKTGKVRGILCRGCNLALAHIRENTSIARAIVRYLKKHAPDAK